MSVWTRRQFACNTFASAAFSTWMPNSLAALPTGSLAKTPDSYGLVDPELIPILRQLPPLILDDKVLAETRRLPLSPPLPAPMPQPVHKQIPGPQGAPEVHIVIVDPAPGEQGRPVMLHMHGGGMVAANTALYPFIQTMSRDCNCVVVSVDYRMAPETRFPGSLEDNYAALKWVHANGKALGINPNLIAVGGESAGGGQAATLAIHARDKGEVPICFQLLIYPMLDDRTGSTRSVPPSLGKFIWTAENNRFGWSALLGTPAGSATVPVNAVPSRVTDLSGLPPTWIGVGSLDLFVDEDIEYARRLIDAGVSTQLEIYPGGYHAFDLLVPSAALSKRFAASWTAAVRRAFLAASTKA